MKSILKYFFLLTTILLFIYLGFFLWEINQKVLAIISFVCGASISISGYYTVYVKPFKLNWANVLSEIESLGFEETRAKQNKAFIKRMISESDLFAGDGVHIDNYWTTTSDIGNHYFGRYVMSSSLSQGIFYIVSQEKELPDCTFYCGENSVSQSLEDSMGIDGENGYQFLANLSDETRMSWAEIPYANIRFMERKVICHYQIGKENSFAKLHDLIPNLVEAIN